MDQGLLKVLNCLLETNVRLAETDEKAQTTNEGRHVRLPGRKKKLTDGLRFLHGSV